SLVPLRAPSGGASGAGGGAVAALGGGPRHPRGPVMGAGAFGLWPLLLVGGLLPGEEHVHRARVRRPGAGGGVGARARTKLLLGGRRRAGTRDQGTETSTESSLLRHGRCPSEKCRRRRGAHRSRALRR